MEEIRLVADIRYLNDDTFNVFKTIPDGSIDLVLTDPPYGINFNSIHSPKGDWDKFSKDEFYEFNKKWMSECFRVLKDTGGMWVFLGPTKIDEVLSSAKEAGFNIHLDKWKSIQRQKGRGSKKAPKSLREDFIFLSKSDTFIWKNINNLFSYKEPTTNALDSNTGNVERPHFKMEDTIFYFKMPYYLSKTEKQFHSCQKSVLLQYALIVNCSNPGDTILDPFMGSGSSGIAALLSGRNYIGAERDTEMYKKAVNWNSTFDVSSYKAAFLEDINE